MLMTCFDIINAPKAQPLATLCYLRQSTFTCCTQQRVVKLTAPCFVIVRMWTDCVCADVNFGNEFGAPFFLFCLFRKTIPCVNWIGRVRQFYIAQNIQINKIPYVTCQLTINEAKKQLITAKSGCNRIVKHKKWSLVDINVCSVFFFTNFSSCRFLADADSTSKFK